MVKKFNEMLENYAEKVNFPYDPVGSEDTILIFSRHFRFCTEPFDNLIFGHRINILNIDKENPCASVFLEVSVSEKPDVKLVNERFVLTSDTLLYNTATKIADIVSPTEIIYEEETDIHSSSGWYNTENERSMLLKRSVVHHEDGRQMTGSAQKEAVHISGTSLLTNRPVRS